MKNGTTCPERSGRGTAALLTAAARRSYSRSVKGGKGKVGVLVVGVALWLAATPFTAAADSGSWEELLSAQPQNSGFAVTGAVLTRDAFTFYLDSGAFFPLPDVSKRVVGGVFRGRGRFELKPAEVNERRLLALRSRQKDLRVLADSFEEAVFLFTDASAEELLKSGQAVRAEGDKPVAAYRRILGRVEKDLHADLRLRLLSDLMEGTPASRGIFLASFDGGKLPPAIAIFSPAGLDRTWLEPETGDETTALVIIDDDRGGAWYSDRPVQTSWGVAPAAAPDFTALHYSVETTIRKNTDIEGRTTLRMRAARAGARLVALDLFSKLRLSAVRLKRGDGPAADVRFVQGNDKSEDPVLVILPATLAPGEEAEIIAEYKGEDVLHDAGENNFYVGARQNWYPDLNGMRDWAVYDLTYRIPKKRQVISVGKLVDSSTDGDFAVYKYTSGRPVRAAGFNYGDFRLVEKDDPDSGVKVRVYTNPGQPDSVKQLQELLPNVHFDTVSMAQDALADSLNTARIATRYFGPLPQNDIAVTQQTEWGFGQSWPTLIYIPYMAFLDWVTRANLGLYDAKSFVEEVTPHEFAHQWWGHRVGSATYRDVWLEEGFAEFTVSLVVERAQGASEFHNYWDRARKMLLETPRHSVCANWEAGPISLGPRLATKETPQAYSAVVYRKGAFVVHMLRNLFWDAKNADHDHLFIAMMKDFIGAWAGRNPTTADFQAVVERDAPAPYTGNMGWFFRQWVEGMTLPRIESSVRIEEAGKGRYRLSGTIVQSGVPDDFRSIVPAYFEFDKGRLFRFAQASITGNNTVKVQGEVELPKRPLRVVVNPNFEWLTGR